MKKIILFLMVMVGAITHGWAIVDDNGRVSTSLIIDYQTGDVITLECDTYEELLNQIKENLQAHVSFSNDETGATVEWTIDNALISNYSDLDGYEYVLFSAYYWCIKPGIFKAVETYPFDTRWGTEERHAMLPGAADCFKLHDGKTIDDVEVTVLDEQTKEIGNYELQYWFEDLPDASPQSRKMADENASPIPTIPYVIRQKPDAASPNQFTVIVYLGHFTPSTWELSATTKFKYHVSNASFSARSTDVDMAIDNGNNQREVLYNLHGIEIKSPQHGEMYILRTGNTARKIIY